LINNLNIFYKKTPMSDEDLYVIDFLRDRRVVRGPAGGSVTQYLVHWEGYAVSDDTWEPRANLPKDMVVDFDKKRAKTKTVTAAAAAAPVCDKELAAVALLFFRCARSGCHALEVRRGSVRSLRFCLNLGFCNGRLMFFL